MIKFLVPFFLHGSEDHEINKQNMLCRVVQSPGVGSHHKVYLFFDFSVLVGVAISLNNTHSKYFAIRKEIKE